MSDEFVWSYPRKLQEIKLERENMAIFKITLDATDLLILIQGKVVLIKRASSDNMPIEIMLEDVGYEQIRAMLPDLVESRMMVCNGCKILQTFKPYKPIGPDKNEILTTNYCQCETCGWIQGVLVDD